MTDNNLSLNSKTIEKLFANGVCLTYSPYESAKAYDYANKLKHDFLQKYKSVKHVQLCSKTAEIPQAKYNPAFHYFSDGTLIHCCYENELLLGRIMKMLQLRNYKICCTYAPKSDFEYMEYSDFLRKISEHALQAYPLQDDLYVTELPEKEIFVSDCFKNGNILLTADKSQLFPADCRSCMALFADGRYYVSENFSGRLGAQNSSKVHIFRQKLMQNYCYCEMQYVPQQYIDALYEKAKEFDWYISPADADTKLKSANKPDNGLQNYIADLFTQRVCLTVTNPDFNSSFMSPDFARYAVFSDGLVVSAYYGENDKIFMRDLQKYFPNKNYRFEKVSDEYITEIYRRLPEFQKSAGVIYIEMLKQKARKLKRMLLIPHHEALDIVAQMAGWKNWKSIKIEDETHARQLIDAEKFRKDLASRFNAENPLEEEWKHFHKHSGN